MIQISQETLIPLREAPRHLPCRPGGKPVHISACYRWVSIGVRGVRLDSLKIGGTTFTSLEAIQRFAEEVTGQSRPPASPSPSSRASREQAQRAVASRLECELGMDPGRLNLDQTDRRSTPRP